MVMAVTIWVRLAPRDDVTNLTVNNVSDPVGPELSAYRLRILDAVINDPVLTGNQRSTFGILGSSGQIVYKGCDTDMNWSAPMRGQMGLFFGFHYLLVPPRG